MESTLEKKDNTVSSSSSSSTEEVKRVIAMESAMSPRLSGSPTTEAEESEGLNCAEESSKQLYSKKSEMGIMKERFAKLLLGEDMSGSGKGVCTALAISNAITNLNGKLFGQLWRLEPLPLERKSMWRTEMKCLLSVADQIIELVPSRQTSSDGHELEVMASRPRSDLCINLPALKKLDDMLIEILDSFAETEFWYIDQGIVDSDYKTNQRQEEKWWLPVPRVPEGGLSDNSRKQLNQKRECANQILKAAVAINYSVLAEMDIPESYLEFLPKTGRACLGDLLYRCITSEQFSEQCLLDFLDLSSNHVALEIVNRVEASIYVWRQRSHPRPSTNSNSSITKSSWGMVKDLVADGDKMELFAKRAENLLLSLQQQFPMLMQTSLDTSKIQCNKDIGKSILESYSRVLESVAYNIVARIDDLLYVDNLTKSSNKLSSFFTKNKHAPGSPFKPMFTRPNSAIAARQDTSVFLRRTIVAIDNHDHQTKDR